MYALCIMPSDRTSEACLGEQSVSDGYLNHYAKKELKIVVEILQNICFETEAREGLNRALVHLESAYQNYDPYTFFACFESIFFDGIVLWKRVTTMNSICIYASVIHYILGNYKHSKDWLSRMDEHGDKSLLDELLQSERGVFYENVICNSNAAFISEHLISEPRPVVDLEHLEDIERRTRI